MSNILETGIWESLIDDYLVNINELLRKKAKRFKELEGQLDDFEITKPKNPQAKKLYWQKHYLNEEINIIYQFVDAASNLKKGYMDFVTAHIDALEKAIDDLRTKLILTRRELVNAKKNCITYMNLYESVSNSEKYFLNIILKSIKNEHSR